MIWLVWRRQRTALLLTASVLLLAAVTLTVGHIVLVMHAWSLGIRSCLDAPRCTDPNLTYANPYPSFAGLARVGLWVVAPLVGWICGIGLYGRELQQRTHLLALTQRASRLRWWATSLAVVVPPALGMAALTALAGWALRPFDSLSPTARIKPLQFDITGVAPVGSLLLAFAIAATAGILLRGTVTATVATALAWSLIFLAVLLTRYDYLPDTRTTTPAVVDAKGNYFAVPDDAFGRSFGYVHRSGATLSLDKAGPLCPEASWREECLRNNEITKVYKAYQPDAHYWPLQAITSALFAALAALVTWLGYRASPIGAAGAGRRARR